RSWLSISTHISMLFFGLSTLALPVDSLDSARWPFPWTVRVILAHVGCLFSTHRTSVGGRQHTRDVCGCSCVSVCFCSVHTERPWVSASTHMPTYVAVHQYTYQHVSPWNQHAGPSRGLFGTHRTSLGVRQHTQYVRGCSWLSVCTHRTFVAIRVGLCVTHRTSVCVRQHTQVVRGCPCVTSVCVRQHTQVVRGLHTGRPWVSASTHRTSVGVRQHTHDVRVCPSAHTGRPWLSVCVRVCPCDFGPCGLSVQYTQDVCGCPSAHTRHPLLSVCVSGCPCVSVSTHRTSVAVHQYTYQHAGPWTQHAGPSRGLFGTHRTSVGVRQHTHDVPHTGCLWLSVSTHRTSVAVRVCPCLSVCVHQHTQDIRRLWLSISTHIRTLVVGLSTLAFPVDCSGDFGPLHTGHPWVSVSTHRTSVCVRQHTQVVRGCPCVSISTHRTSVAVHQYTYQHVGPWTQHADPSLWVILAHVGCLFSTHRTSVGVRQHTHDDVRGCPPAHTGRSWLSVCVRVCP
ncbi:unnamed protein product, partial [Brassica rapa]